ncbi:hypothetical protein J4573_18760 [Actinomadura barringtoniae]|uniref:Uncharacterized protein n=1 Tax=Actinomadura barringtoniae TaxID=1427535 RepID=A0A939T7B9_9ACTN|nr:hypothetical protein [Actinomadura barringtoniae]MBO2449152.1 hypothetical protein [Actinomadura barringtoniae]
MQTTAKRSMTVLACVAVLVGGGMFLVGTYGWFSQPGPTAAHPLQSDRVVVYLGCLVVAVGALLLQLAGERGPALAILATALIPVLLVLPGTYARDVALYPCVILVPVATAVAVRAVLVPGTPIIPVTVAAFTVVMVAGTYLLIGGLNVALVFEPTHEALHGQAVGRVVALASGLALASAPLMLGFTGHKNVALAVAPFALVSLLAVAQRLALVSGIAYLLTGPVAVGATIYAMFTARR